MNHKLLKIRVLLGLAAIFFLTAGILAGRLLIEKRQSITQYAAASTELRITPSTQNVYSPSEFNFFVTMDTGTNAIIGVDVQLNFDPTIIQISGISPGNGISVLNHTILDSYDNSAGTVSYSAFTLDKRLAISGSGLEVLRINARVRDGVNPGNHSITFDESSAVSATSENHNVLSSTTPGTFYVLSNPTTPPTVAPTQAPTSAPPNSCGGTCGSDSNCASNLRCYQGFCRNPSCYNSTSCVCSTVTPAPTQAPTQQPTQAPTQSPYSSSSPTSTPEPIAYIPESTPVVETTPEPELSNFWEKIYNEKEIELAPTPTTPPIETTPTKNVNILAWIIGSFMVAGLMLILIVIGIYKDRLPHKKKPPVIKI